MKFALPLAALVLATVSAPAMAAFTLSNDNGGDGYVVVDPLDPRIFTLFSANNAPDIDSGFNNVTSYGQTATSVRVINVRWSHVTTDERARFDPAGWFLGEHFFQLTDDDITTGIVQGGSFQIAVNPGDEWGFYIGTSDSFGGRGQLNISTVPEPGSWAMLIAGFGLTGAAMRRRRLARA